MITKEEVKKLATLARLEVSPESLDGLAKELGTIIEYVGQIDSALTQEADRKLSPNNVFRQDTVVNQTGEYTSSLLSSAPASENGFVKVKKIM